MKNFKNIFEGKYIINTGETRSGDLLLIESVDAYGDDFIFTFVCENKKTKKVVNADEMGEKKGKLRELDVVERDNLKWQMPKDLLTKSVDEIANYMMAESPDYDTAKKRLNFYQDRVTGENKDKLADVKLRLSDMNSKKDNISITSDDLIEFINDNKELPIADIFKGMRALIDTSKSDQMMSNDPVPATDPNIN